MAWITIPFTFRGKGGQRVPVSQIDDDFAAIANALNIFNPTGTPAGPGGIQEVRNLVAQNDAGSPNTLYTFDYDSVLLRNPLDGSFAVHVRTGPLHNDVSTPGPTPNGRDQVVAFAANTWLHWYFIWNPTSSTIATLSSLTPPPTGPTVPSGFTMWAYIGAMRVDGLGNLNRMMIRGAEVFWNVAPIVVSGGMPAQNVETAVNVAALIPPNALTYLINVAAVYTNGSNTATHLLLRVVTTEDVGLFTGVVPATAASAITCQVLLPNVGQQYLYLWNVDVVSGPVFRTDQWVSAFRIPNGGE